MTAESHDELAEMGIVEAQGQSTAELEQLESALTPIQRYMLRFVEESEAAATAAEEAALALQQGPSEFDFDEMARIRDEEERAASEDDDVLYYELPAKGASAAAPAKGAAAPAAAAPAEAAPKGKGRGKKRGAAAVDDSSDAAASGSQTEGAAEETAEEAAARRQAAINANAMAYYTQQLYQSGLEGTDELIELEAALWGPPPPPDAVEDEVYVSAPAFTSESEMEGGAARRGRCRRCSSPG